MTSAFSSDDDMTELVDAQIDRVDLVGTPANGRPFVLMKAAADGGLTQPLVPADQVRALLEKAQEAPVTDPAAPLVKAEIDVTDAPAADDLIPTAPGGSTANSLPGSPDWEQLDGDTAMNAVAVLGRLKGVLGWLADREAQEAVTGDGDGSNAWDLDDMACSLDWMIGRLAAFAVGEHMEADELESVGKACAAMVAPLAVVERLAPVAKAGRTFSAANEATMRGAVDDIDTAAEKLRGLLNSLPQAPAAEDVTKETAVPEIMTPNEARAALAAEPVDVLAKALAALPALDAFAVAGALLAGGRTQDVAKAAGDPQLAVFDADGKLIGTIDPAKLSPIAASPAAAEPKTDEPADEAPADDAPAADPAAAPVADDGSAVIPGTNTVQAPAPENDQTPAVAKTADPAALEEQIASLAKQVANLAEDRDALKEQVRKFGMTPDDRNSPILNGATGVAGAVNRDNDPSTDDLVADLKKAVNEEADPVKRQALAVEAFRIARRSPRYADPVEVAARFGV